jgi:membrane associated rhomboid family serine protease
MHDTSISSLLPFQVGLFPYCTEIHQSLQVKVVMAYSRSCKSRCQGRSRRHLRFVLCLLCVIFGRCAAFQTPLRGLSISTPKRTFPTFTTNEFSRQRQQQQPPCRRMHQNWEGDDMRWSTRLRRKLLRQKGDSASPVKTSLIVLNLLFFFYQTITTINLIRRGHPEYWPRHAFPMITDAIVGSAVHGPLTLDFSFSNALSKNQPHRFLTSGFLHGGIVHLLINLDTLRRQPSWLETGLGAPLYLTAFLVSIVTGNIGHMYGVNNPFDHILCLGASGGICGLYGLMYVSLIRMGNSRAASRIAKGMATLFAMGLVLDGVSTASHVGGFLGGLATAILCGPSYGKNYSMRRKNSAEYDPTPRDYRLVMGFGVMPTERGMLPLPLIWGALAILFAASKPKFRAMPAMILQGFLFPGSLSP